MVSRRSQSSGRRSFLKYASGVTAVTLAGCTDGDDSGQDVDTVTVGSVHPETGPLAFDGQRMQKMIQLAAELRNENGGIESLDGAEIEVVTSDSEASQEVAGPATEEVINEGASVVLGEYTSPGTMAATGVSERQQTPFVITVATDPEILVGRDTNYTYRVQPNSTVQADNYAEYTPPILDEFGYEANTMGHVFINDSFGRSLADPLVELLADQGIEVTLQQGIEVAQEDLSSEALRVKEEDPDILCTTSYATAGRLLWNSFQDIGYTPKFIVALASPSFGNPEPLRQMGDDVNGSLHISLSHNPTNPRTAEVTEEFQNRYGEDFDVDEVGLDGVHYLGFTAARTAFDAIEMAGSTDTEEINNALKDIQIEETVAALPGVDFKDNGENSLAKAICSQSQELEPRVVWPQEFAESELIDPALR